MISAAPDLFESLAELAELVDRTAYRTDIGNALDKVFIAMDKASGRSNKGIYETGDN